MSNASCSRCEREPVQVIEGHFSNGRRVEDPRCVRHSEPPESIGNRVLRGKSSSRFEITAIRQIEAAPHEAGRRAPAEVPVEPAAIPPAAGSQGSPDATAGRSEDPGDAAAVTAAAPGPEPRQLNIDLRHVPAVDGVFVWDEGQRIYMLRRRTSDNWHIVRALPADDASVRAGEAAEGTLTCCCPGGQFHHSCWAMKAVEAYEERQQDPWAVPARVAVPA